MSTVVPAPPAAAGPEPGAAPPARRARKRFILIGFGIGILAVVLFGLFTSLGTSPSSSPAPHAGGRVPAFSAANVGPVGGPTVTVSAGGNHGAPTVLVFFGAWCSACLGELPPLAAAVQDQARSGGPLAKVRVLGVDTLDSAATGRAFIAKEGVRFPVASDPDGQITSGQFYFRGDPYAVFVKGDGTITDVVAGPMTPAAFTAAERALIPSGS